MKILVPRIINHYLDKEIQTYSGSVVRELRNVGHEVTEVSKQRFTDLDKYKEYDLLLDIDCGRDTDQSYTFHIQEDKVPIKSAVILIDTHGKADIHQHISRHADHVFFAVWDKRDVFSDHPSAHWFPNFTDSTYFDVHNLEKQFDFCFFGTRTGIDRADPMVNICNANGFTYDVDEVGRFNKHRWPRTAERMSRCRFGFNHGQKHDGPNLRVMETMAVKIPLICDQDPRDGKGYLFEPWQHYIPYEAYTYKGLEERMKWCLGNPEKAAKIAENAYDEIKLNHLVEHRVATLLEIVKGS